MWLKSRALGRQLRDFYSDSHNLGFFLFLVVALVSVLGKNHWCRPHRCWIWALPLPLLLVVAAFRYWNDIWDPIVAAFHHRNDIWHPNRPRTVSGTEAQGRSFWGELGRTIRDAVILVPLFSFLMIQVETFGWFERLDNAFLDNVLRLRAQTKTTNVVIIEIDDKDYRVFFDAISPLKASTVWTIIRLIQDAKPRLIAVDLDTRGSDWNTLVDTVGKAKVIDPGKIIWAEVPLIDDGRITPTCVLGGQLKDWDEGTGVDLLPRDEDGVVRRYQDQYPVTGRLSPNCSTSATEEAPNSNPHLVQPRLPYAFHLVQPRLPQAFNRVVAAKSGLGPNPKTEGDYYIRFLSRQSFPIQYVRELRNLDEKQREVLLGGKIVLLGGTFAAARDSYSTPLGEMPGVEILADALESDLMPSPVHVATWYWRWIFDIGSGLVITVIYFIWRNRPGTALVLSLLSLSIPLLVGLVFVRWWAVWLNAAPVMVGMIFHEKVESTHTAAEVSERQG